MVKLNKIYTRTGDDGTTGLGTGDRVPKDDRRVAAYGEIDEANAALGLAVIAATNSGDDRTAALLELLQHDLFDAGADLCIPLAPDEKPDAALRVTRAQIIALEHHIDSANEHLAPLTSFVLPGGTPLAAALHLARTIARRAERATVALAQAEPERTSPLVTTYLNRLSDLLFVLARLANDNGHADILWKPGANRD